MTAGIDLGAVRDLLDLIGDVPIITAAYGGARVPVAEAVKRITEAVRNRTS